MHTVAFNDVAEPEAVGEKSGEGLTIKIQAFIDVNQQLESASRSGSVSAGPDNESVSLETDDCLDEGVLGGCLGGCIAAG